MKKLLSCFLTLFVAALFLPSCAKKDTNVLRVMYYSCAELNPLWQQTVAEFQKKHPGIKVRMELIVNQVQLQTQMAANAAPDVIYIASKSLADFGKRGALLDLREYIYRDKYDIDDIVKPAFDESAVPTGEIYGIPVTGGPEVLYYNKTLFDTAKVAYPTPSWTWKEYADAAKKLTVDTNKDGTDDQKGTLAPITYWAGALPWIWPAGGDMFNKDLTRCVVNSKQAQYAMQYWVDLINAKSTTTGTAMSEMGNSTELFMTNRVAMMVYVPWATISEFCKNQQLNWDVTLPPKGPDGTRVPRYTGESFCIWSGSKYKPESWELVKMLTSKDTAKFIAKAKWVPVRWSVLASPDFIRPDTPYKEEVFVESLKYARGLPSVPKLGGQGGGLAEIWSKNMDLSWRGDLTVPQALKNIEDGVNKLLSE
ncbi:MAG: sugar ABC transporter substrate-binding protein [Elusimicrobiota bacterium]